MLQLFKSFIISKRILTHKECTYVCFTTNFDSRDGWKLATNRFLSLEWIGQRKFVRSEKLFSYSSFLCNQYQFPYRFQAVGCWSLAKITFFNEFWKFYLIFSPTLYIYVWDYESRACLTDFALHKIEFTFLDRSTKAKIDHFALLSFAKL